jgi:hypothetical protein
MIADVNKQHRRAYELTEIWDRYLPSFKGRAPIEFWMVQLEDFNMNVLVQGIKRLARKRLTNDMLLPEMLAYVAQISSVIDGDRAGDAQ